jgi:hypothetical protein
MELTKIIMIVLMVLIIVGGLIGLWLLSRVTPKGSVLLLSIVIWVIGGVITRSRIPELWVIGGSIGMVGFIGGILGLIDLVRKPKEKQESKTETFKPEKKLGATAAKQQCLFSIFKSTVAAQQWHPSPYRLLLTTSNLFLLRTLHQAGKSSPGCDTQ